jgi:hypothetical protein
MSNSMPIKACRWRKIWGLWSKAIIVALMMVCFVRAGIPAGSGGGVYEGFVKGNDYQNMDRDSRMTYVMGIYDAIQLAPLLGAPMERLHLFHKLTERMTNEQVTAIVDNYIKDNPQEWHLPMSFLAFTAISKAIGLKPLPQ